MKAKFKTLPGINIQWPWSRLIMDGKKTIETRHYRLPEKYRNRPLALIETPGPSTSRRPGAPTRARVIALVIFSDSLPYRSKEAWLSDFRKHCVAEDDSSFGYAADKTKWAWVVRRVMPLRESIPAPKRKGIKFTRTCKIPETSELTSWRAFLDPS